MKKFILLAMSLVVLSAGSFAQNKKKGSDAPKQTENTQKTDDSRKTKKDGTPDMRYKDNKATKEAPAPAGPTKKDGSPDMRYKANKKEGAKEKK